MAEKPDVDNKTEAPSPRRREQAYEQGEFASSSELVSGVALFVGVAALAYLAQSLGAGLLDQTRYDLSLPPPAEMTPQLVQRLLGSVFGQALVLSGILLCLLFLVTVAVSIAQSGIHVNPDKLAVKWERISFFEFGRLLGWNKILRGLIMLCKVAAVSAVAWWILRQRGDDIARLTELGLVGAVGHAWGIVWRLAVGLSGTLVVIGVIDYAVQRWRFERSLMMTRQELKEEFKREEGNPQVKAKLRSVQREIARRKMFQAIAGATVVVTNPTHLAVALRYEAGKMGAPRVVAKGAGHIAKKIVALARQHNVPVLERKPLAQALFKTVKVDREIPLALYLVVAELLAYVYRLKARNGQE